MTIQYHHPNFLIGAKDFEILLSILPTGHLAMLHLGAPLYTPIHQIDSLQFRRPQNRGLSVYTTPGVFEVPLGHERLAYPSPYSGDFRTPAFSAEAADGQRRFDLVYKTHRITKGSPDIPGMPHLRLSGDHAQTLEIDVFDAHQNLTVTLCYTALKDLATIAFSQRIHNGASQALRLNSAMSGCISLPDAQWQLLQLSGDWIRERQLIRRHLTLGTHSFGSTRGASSAHHNPFAALARPEATEHSGEVLGMSLIYSGNFIQTLDIDEDQQLRWLTGIHPEGFYWHLEADSTFQTPQCVISRSTQGLNGLSHTQHQMIHQYLMPPHFQNSERPVLINNWEATYFQFDEQKLLDLADAAKNVGVELFVLDDGWFSTRNNDQQGLGNWKVNTQKLPSGLKGLSEKIKAKGLKFGLWIEPEMINTDAPIFKENPHWVIGLEPRDTHKTSRVLAQARHQYILDYSNPDLVSHVFEQLTDIFDTVSLDYLKWDMNRNFSEGYSASLSPQTMGGLYHRYILGVYSLYERLTQRYPHLLIESCAAGGGRFDLGLLYYAPQAWASDNSDGLSRLSIQYGTSIGYPISAIGAHISAVPNHQTHRETPLSFRGAVSFFGAFGLELNLLDSCENQNVLKMQIGAYKTLRSLLHYGDFYRLLGPFANGPAGLYGQVSWEHSYGQPHAWGSVSKDKTRAFFAHYAPLAYPNPGLKHLKLSGLDPLSHYWVIPEPQAILSKGSLNPDTLLALAPKAFCVSGSYLMQVGLLMPPPFNGIETSHDYTGDYVAHLWYLFKES